MNIFVLFLLLLVPSQLLAQTEVLFLPQIHNLGPKTDKKHMEGVVRSQYSILRHLNLNRGGVLFVEGASHPLLAYSIGDVKSARIVVAFQEGVPHDYNSLTELQKELLFNYNQGQIPLLLGLVDAVLPAENRELLRNANVEMNTFFNQFPDATWDDMLNDKRVRAALYEHREKFAVEQIEKFKPQEGQSIFLQYGRAHLFENIKTEKIFFRRVNLNSDLFCSDIYTL